MQDLSNSARSGASPRQNQSDPIPVGVPSQPQGSLNKEQAMPPSAEDVVVQEIGQELELPKELEQIGLQKHSETITLPPDVRKMGVTAGGPSQPVMQTATIQLPLTDDQIITGQKAGIMTSIRWLTTWCLLQLKKAHVQLKVVAGKVVRQST